MAQILAQIVPKLKHYPDEDISLFLLPDDFTPDLYKRKF